MIDAQSLTEEMMDEIAEAFDAVAVCDDVCLNLFIKNKWALHKTVEWAKSDAPYIKRAAFVIMAGLAKEDEKAQNFVFRVFVPIMIRECEDERDVVKEAISWALKSLGARNEALYQTAIETANTMLKIESPSAKWIAKDALDFLEGNRA